MISNPRKILLTGVSSGFGVAIAARLLRENQHIIGIARRQPDVLLAHSGYTHYTIDLSQLDALPTQLQCIVHDHADIDAIICCAGYGQFGSLEEFSFAQIRTLLDVNFTSHAMLIRALIPSMKQRQRGNIIFIGSEAALTGTRKGAVYCASKFALRGFAQALRDESSKSGLHVTLINPGMASTEFYDQLSFTHGEDHTNYLRPEDLADAVCLVLRARHGAVFDEINLSPLKKVVRPKT